VNTDISDEHVISIFRADIHDIVIIFIRSIGIVTDLINALPGNSPVYTVQYATIEEAVFL
jgi:hypothetical protein